MKLERCTSSSPTLILVAAAILLSSRATADQKSFLPGEVLKAVDLNANFVDLDTRLVAAETLLQGSVPHAEQADEAAAASLGTFTVPEDLAVQGDVAIGGQLSIGLTISTTCTPGGSGYSDCTCAPGTQAISGGAYSATGYLDESKRTDDTTWRVACKNLSGVRIPCSSAQAICARVGN